MRGFSWAIGGTTILLSLACAGGSGPDEDGDVYIDTFFDSGEPGIQNLPDATDDDDDDDDVSDSEDATDSVEVPDSAYCADVIDWDANWSEWEEEVVVLVNERRAAGAICGTDEYAPTHPLTMNAELRCAARVHSKDMHDRRFFDHINPDGETPWDRIAQAGYNSAWAGENVALGYPNARSVVDGWMTSPGHCANIMSDTFDEIGVGYYTPDHYWTQTFGG